MKFPRSVVTQVFDDLRRLLDPTPALGCPHALCDRLCPVGGYRRGKDAMKDIEILYIPRLREELDATSELFPTKAMVNVTERLWDQLLANGTLAKRHKQSPTSAPSSFDLQPSSLPPPPLSSWGSHIKHALHVPTGLAVDLFAATPASYANRLVVTTGPLELNIRIAEAARALQPPWEWEVGQAGFVPLGGTWDNCPHTRRIMKTEREVFDFVHLPYQPPEQRDEIETPH